MWEREGKEKELKIDRKGEYRNEDVEEKRRRGVKKKTRGGNEKESVRKEKNRAWRREGKEKKMEIV